MVQSQPTERRDSMTEPDHIYNKPAYKFLDASFPELRNRNGSLDIIKLADVSSVSANAIYKAIACGRITKNLAKKLSYNAKSKDFDVKVMEFARKSN